MKSITSFLRRRGYPLREIRKLLCQLDTKEVFATTELMPGGALDEVLEQLKREPFAAKIARSRSTLAEQGIRPSTEYGHTLKVPISTRPGAPLTYLCFTRVAEDRWVYFVDPQNEGSVITVHS